MATCKINEGFIYVTNYSFKFRERIQKIASLAEERLPSKKLSGIGVFLFGSPSRQEMVDESDADIMIIREQDNQDYIIFREEFIRLLKLENFDKIDVPDWGNYVECKSYLEASITEGNQIIESKFIYGDFEVNKFIELLKNKYCNPSRFEKVFCFQKFYFDQYYTQRTREGVKNVKYGHGGTRDFMFITWFVNLLDSLDGRKINIEDNFPLAYKSLSSLYERKLINVTDYISYLESINIVLILRNEILIQNKGTSESGLTYLDERTLKILLQRKLFKDESLIDRESLKLYLEKHLRNVESLKGSLWDLFLSYLHSTRGHNWTDRFRRLLSKNILLEDIMSISEDDELSQMAVIWNISKECDVSTFEYIFSKYSKSNKWTVLTSICCHKDCPDEILNKIVESGFKKGYEYLLRVISRNKNVSKITLKKIMDNSSLEERYRLVAKIAYERGVDKANELR